MHTRWFTNLDEVEYMLDTKLWYDEQEAITIYLATGIRPDPKGCWHCSASKMRHLTWEIDQVEDKLDRGELKWPWTTSARLQSSESIPVELQE